MAKHTPGPWKVIVIHPGFTMDKVADYEIWGGDGMNLVCRYKPVDSEDNEANARLIATAPDLLEACKEALIDLEFLKDYIPRGSNSIKKLKQAIAKAEQQEDLE